MKQHFVIFFATFCLVGVSGQIYSENQDRLRYWKDTVSLEDVTVSVLGLKESLQEATGSVYIVNAEDLDLKLSITTTELINLATGVYMASGTYNTNRLVIRGVGSRSPYSTNRIRAYLDDIPLTSGDGISTLEDLELSGIGTMEILKGPSSALYGSGLGGIVRLNSPYPNQSGFSMNVFSEFGSFNTSRVGFKTSFKDHRMATTAGITRSHSDGYRENSDYTRSNAFLNSIFFGHHSTLSVTLSLINLFARIPSSLNETDFITQPGSAAPNWFDVRGFEEYLKVLGGLKIESKIGRQFTNHLIIFSSFMNPYESRPFNILDEQATNLGFREYLQFEQGTFSFKAGLEYFHEWYNWQIYETDNGSKGSLLSDHDEVRKYTNLFALGQWRPNEKILIDGGFNLNLLHYNLHTNYQFDSTNQSGSYSYPLVPSPRIGISYRHHKKHHLYASAGHGFSAPSLEETLLPEGTINTDLKPESGWNLELGHRGKFLQDRIQYDAAMYTIFLNNLLVTERITEDIFTGANAGNALNGGLELWLKFPIINSNVKQSFNVEGTLGYTLSASKFMDFIDEGVDYRGNSLPGIPGQILNSVISGKVGPVAIKLHHKYTGNQWMNDTNDQKYEAYHLIHFQVNWKLFSSIHPIALEVYGGIKNMLDTSYASMILINAPSFGGNPPRYYYPGLPRQFHMGIRVNFG